MRALKCLILLGLLAALCAPGDVLAQPKWGLGGFVDFNMPLRGLGDRFSNEAKFGGTLNYVKSPAITLEIEYHHSRFDNGKPASVPFYYAPDDASYKSPEGRSEVTFNSMAVNALIFPGDENAGHGFRARDYRFFVLAGGGIYRYKSINENLVFAGQTGSPIDLTLVMDPQVDQRYAIAANLGVGFEAFVLDNISVDARVRYNLVIGELRPMLFYELERTWPLQLVDFGVGMKFYFWR